MLRPVMMLKT